MSQRRQEPPTSITIDPNDSLPAVLQHLREHAGQRVVLEIPDHCPVLLTATEFRTVKELAEREKIDLSLRTADRLRRQLASMFGLKNLADAVEQPNEGWRPPQTMLGSPRAYGTWNKDDDRPDEIEPGMRSRRRRGVGTVVETPRYEKREDDNDVGSLEYLNDQASFLNARNVGRIVAAVLVVGLIALAAGWYYMPAVTVDAMLKNQTVSNELLYSVAAPGATLPSDIAFTADASEENATVDFVIALPTTGVERTPDQTATGTVLLRNPTEAAVNVPAGTPLAVFAGPTFTTDAAVDVPAAADGQAGEASVEVTADQAGAASNVEAGMLTGKLDEPGVFYSNRDAAIEGGTDIEVAVASEEDIANLEQQVETNLDRAAARGWVDQLSEGQSVVEPSVETGEPTYELNNQAGDETEEIRLSGTVDASGLVYDLAEVEAQALEFFREALQEEVPEGYRLDPETVTLGAPEVLAEAPDNVQYRVEATGVVNAVFSTGQQGGLASDLAGGSWGNAESTIGGIEAFETWEISQSPGWWPERFPQAPDRVTVHVARAPAAGSAGDPTPGVTPEGEGT